MYYVIICVEIDEVIMLLKGMYKKSELYWEEKLTFQPLDATFLHFDVTL